MLTTLLLLAPVILWLKPSLVLGELPNSGDAMTGLHTDAGNGSLPGLVATGGMETTAMDKLPVTDLEDTMDGL